MENPAEVFGGPVSHKPSIFAAIEQGFLKDPKATAVVVRHQAGSHLAEILPSDGTVQDAGRTGTSGCVRWTYAQLHHAAACLVTGLSERGVHPGSMVATFIPNGIEYLLLVWASALGKFGLANLDAGALSDARAEELDFSLAAVQPAAIVLFDSSGTAAIHRSLGEQKANRTLVVSLDNTTITQSQQHAATLIELCRQSTTVDAASLADAARDDTADRVSFILFTSGTSSGRPKGVPRYVKSMVFSIEGQEWSLPGEGTGNRLMATTNFRAIAPILALRAWRDGATVVMPGPSFTPSTTLDAIEQEHITEAVLIPAMIHAMVAEPSFASRDLSSLRLILSGGDIVTRALVEKSMKHFPNAGFVAAHGMTEGGALTQWELGDAHGSGKYFGEIASLGGVTKGTRLRIVEDGKVVKRGQAGELHCMNESILKHYVGGDHADTFYTDEFGQWFKTGDLSIIDEDGGLFIVGRLKDIIKRSGVSVVPSAIESTLNAFTNSQTAVLAVPNDVLGHEPFAVLESFHGKTEDMLKNEVMRKFGKDYALAGAVQLKALGMHDMPLNASNKVNKLALQQPLKDYLEAKRAGSL